MKFRESDIIKHNHIHLLSIFFIILFFIILSKTDIKPHIFARINSNNLNKSFNKNNDKKIKSDTDLNILKDILISNSFNENDFEAKSFVVYDVKKDKILYSKDENMILPLASLTKVISAATAISLANRDTNIKIDKSLMRAGEKLDFGIKNGQVWRLDDLLKYSLTISSNSAIDIIASSISPTNSLFVKSMNDYVSSLGFKSFYFNSASGLDYGDIIGGKGNAIEYSKFFSETYKYIPDILSYTSDSKINIKSENKNIYQIPNTNKDASKSIGLLASKTGFTDAAGGNLAVIFDYEINRPIVIVVLGSTIDGRFKDVDKLYELFK